MTITTERLREIMAAAQNAEQVRHDAGPISGVDFLAGKMNAVWLARHEMQKFCDPATILALCEEILKHRGE